MLATAPLGGHAYSHSEIKELGAILGVSEGELPKLRRHADELAALIGLATRVERDTALGTRVKQLKSRFLKPAEALTLSLSDDGLKRELWQPWGALLQFETETFEAQLSEFIARTKAHIEIMEQRQTKGKNWDTDLKRHFAGIVTEFCEYFDRDFEPTRNVQMGKEERTAFRECVYLLAKPIFKDEVDGTAGLDRAIRAVVDDWNRGKRILWEEIRATKA